VLTLDTLFEGGARAANLVLQVVLAPRVVRRTDLVTAYRILDAADADALLHGELGDVGQRGQCQAVGAIGQSPYRFGTGAGVSARMAGKQRDKLSRRRLARLVIRPADDQRGDALGIEGKPRGQILRTVDQPQDGVEERRDGRLRYRGGGRFGSGHRWWCRHDGVGGERELFGSNKEAVLPAIQMVGRARQARGEIEHQRTACLTAGAKLAHQLDQ
jgi:hypothetical protein